LFTREERDAQLPDDSSIPQLSPQDIGLVKEENDVGTLEEWMGANTREQLERVVYTVLRRIFVQKLIVRRNWGQEYNGTRVLEKWNPSFSLKQNVLMNVAEYNDGGRVFLTWLFVPPTSMIRQWINFDFRVSSKLYSAIPTVRMRANRISSSVGIQDREEMRSISPRNLRGRAARGCLSPEHY
jgi:hypothetical protein